VSKPVVALQLYTIRDFINADLKGTLAKVKEMGYNYVELAGLYDLSAQEFRQILDETGLQAISAHVGYGDLANDLDGTVAAYKTLGCKYAAIPWADSANLPGGANWAAAKKFFIDAGAKLKAAGITPMYHNHEHELEKLPNGELILDAFYNELPDYHAQMDTGWIAFMNMCPAEYIGKYAGRCPSIHFKDTIVTDGKITDYPVGSGSQDIPAIAKTAVAGGAKFFVAELDDATGMTSMEAAKQSLEYLKSLGY